MAVIKSGAGSDQLTIDAVSKAARVTLYDALGNAATFSLNANVSTLATEAGNLASLLKFDQQTAAELLRLILIELRVMNQVLCDGLNVSSDQYDGYRNDRQFIDTGIPLA